MILNLPDLIVIDGGKGQLSAASVTSLGVSRVGFTLYFISKRK